MFQLKLYHKVKKANWWWRYFDDENQQLNEEEIWELVQGHPSFQAETKESIHDLLRGLYTRGKLELTQDKYEETLRSKRQVVKLLYMVYFKHINLHKK